MHLNRLVSELRAAGCVFAEEEAELLLAAAPDPGELAGLLARRTAGEPLEHVVGWAGFRGLRMAVGPGAFVPRRRSEYLAKRAVAAARPGAVVLDLCCGVGAVGAAVAAAVPGVRLHAADIGEAAVRYARANLAGTGGRVFLGDLYAPLPAELTGRVDVLVANAPYVPTGDLGLLPPEAREHEPAEALDGGADGLDVQRRVIAGAPAWLAPGGTLLVETGRRQAPLTASLFRAAGLTARIRTSEAYEATVVTGGPPD
ncbi:putative protein N(5)-glutamine methyltransferase [Streptomyces sp. NPDC097619]|uniref:putative protein N(5)-glutamine methyltransferase n=1 Tax=Streptomyces sp. NPDC097619 TaxID=3157228 RepID=UPI0033278DF1